MNTVTAMQLVATYFMGLDKTDTVTIEDLFWVDSEGYTRKTIRNRTAELAAAGALRRVGVGAYRVRSTRALNKFAN